ncbi:hypothetical protein [Serratia marcescens]|uniref:hypothetical protein n=1 Tax=Serratia marcescens TaxID=615 RepID=UPI0011C46B86|nr:hypothetical protein [Serratia marcescens]EIM8479550.1 hypothetical protein [Serratia marcescens]EIU9508447.1 hypothetical protein [Serratia marcescens]MBH2619412.1 hypothetical protein [Serratia marcescens]MBI6196243.1 hypothetical protein [Serratia marcescens]MBN5270767.1 hypothetical protein [Serratia marcescens]
MSELSVGAFCIHKTRWGKRGCEVIAFHNGAVVVKHFGSGYRGVPTESLTLTTEDNARRTERNHHAEMKRG